MINRPLVLLSNNSLHSSSTLLAATSSATDGEVTDIEEPEDFLDDNAPRISVTGNSTGFAGSDVISTGSQSETGSVEEIDSTSVSVYESALSSIYDTPISSPPYFATPSEGRSPILSPESGKFRETTANTDFVRRNSKSPERLSPSGTNGSAGKQPFFRYYSDRNQPEFPVNNPEIRAKLATFDQLSPESAKFRTKPKQRSPTDSRSFRNSISNNADNPSGNSSTNSFVNPNPKRGDTVIQSPVLTGFRLPSPSPNTHG